jgi:hypothetical protein
MLFRLQHSDSNLAEKMVGSAGIWGHDCTMKSAITMTCLFFSATVVAQNEDYVEHRLKAGESPFTLARDYLSSPNTYPTILRVNGIANARTIPSGTIIRLPRHLLAYRSASLRVEAFSGEVTIDGRAASRGMTVPEGAKIRTGRIGFVSLRGSDGSAITMPTNTQVQLVRARIYRLDDLKDIEFTVLEGRGEAQVRSLRARERYKISTPKAVTAVRGTVFRVGYDDKGGRSVVEVIEGAVSTEAGEQEALTAAGFGIATTPAGFSPQERLLLPPEIVQPSAVQTQPMLSFEITLPPSAVGIRTQIARDAGFIDIIGENVSKDGQAAAFSDVDDGRYFVRARAISASGIEGQSEVYSFRRKRLGASASAQPSPLDDAYRFVWLQDGEGETTYAFQLWNAANPAMLIADEVALNQQEIVMTDLEPGTYEWRVAAIQIDEEGLLQVWGPTQRLNVAE